MTPSPSSQEAGQLALQSPEPGPPPSPQVAAARVTKGTYLHPLAHYESVYDLKANRGRTIKRWVATGRKKGDFPPLDQPERMAAWWGRHMTWTVPARLLTLAGSEAEPPPPPAASSPAQPLGALSPPLPPPSNVIRLPEGSGFAAAMGRAQEAERTAYAKWQEELESPSPDEGREEMRRRAWERATKIVREMERDAEGILSRDLIAWPDAEVRVSEILTVVNRSLRSLFVRVSTKIGLPQEWFSKADAQYQLELDQCFEELADDDYQEKPGPPPPGPDFTLAAA